MIKLYRDVFFSQIACNHPKFMYHSPLYGESMIYAPVEATSLWNQYTTHES